MQLLQYLRLKQYLSKPVCTHEWNITALLYDKRQWQAQCKKCLEIRYASLGGKPI